MEINGATYTDTTPRAVMVALESLRQSGHLARIWYGYTDNSDPDAIPGRAWPEEHDVIGTIGLSRGTVKLPLLIEEGEDGGPAILDHRIVRLDDATDGRTLYQHPEFSPGFNWSEPVWDEQFERWVVCNNEGVTHARFTDEATARAWIDFMCGDSYTRPQASKPVEPDEPEPLIDEEIEAMDKLIDYGRQYIDLTDQQHEDNNEHDTAMALAGMRKLRAAIY